MVNKAIQDAVACLRAYNYRVTHAYPKRATFEIHDTMLTVEVEKLDQVRNTTTVLVNVLNPVDMGCEQCEDVAMEACVHLQAAGGLCSTGRCEFLPGTNAFCLPISVIFRGTENYEETEEEQ